MGQDTLNDVDADTSSVDGIDDDEVVVVVVEMGWDKQDGVDADNASDDGIEDDEVVAVVVVVADDLMDVAHPFEGGGSHNLEEAVNNFFLQISHFETAQFNSFHQD